MQHAVSEKEPIPGAVIAVQTFGDFLGFNPHCHILLTDGCFYGERNVSGRASSGTQKAGSHLPAQGIQDAPEQGKDNERDDCHALNMAAFRF